MLAEVGSVAEAGTYTRIELLGEGLGSARPGQFVAVAVPGHVTARVFSVHHADPVRDVLSVVVAIVGEGTRWLAARRPGDRVSVTGPLGNAFDLPGQHRAWLGVGGGYGAAPLSWAAREAQRAGARVGAVIGAGVASRLCDVDGVRDVVDGSLWVITDDGSAGRRGRVTDVLAEAIAAVGGPATPVTVAACGPMAMLAAVATTAQLPVPGRAGATVRVEVAVEERMACGIGICMTCVMPVRHSDGVTRMTRTCTAGPVFDATSVRWDCLVTDGSRVPADAEGALL